MITSFAGSMPSAPDFDHPLEPALLEPAEQIAEVGREVRRLAVRAVDHAIFFLCLGGVAEPHGAVLLLEITAGPQASDRVLWQLLAPQPRLVEPFVVAHPESGNAGPDAIDHRRNREGAQLVRVVDDAGFLRPRHLGDLGHVVADVAALGWLLPMQPRVHRLAEEP